MSVLETKSARNISKIFWTYLHLGLLEGIVAVFPVIPGHSFRIDLNIEVLTIQIGVETSVVPPGACITQGTFATTSFVIITILDGK